MPLEHLRLEDLSDREVLLVMLDVADADGWVDALQVGLQFGIAEEHALRTATSRLTWLMRWEVVQREPEEDVPKPPPGEPRRRRRWGLTPKGQDMATGEVSRTRQQALESARDTDMLALTRMLAEKQRQGGLAVRNLVRREWRYRTEYSRNGR